MEIWGGGGRGFIERKVMDIIKEKNEFVSKLVNATTERLVEDLPALALDVVIEKRSGDFSYCRVSPFVSDESKSP